MGISGFALCETLTLLLGAFVLPCFVCHSDQAAANNNLKEGRVILVKC